MDNSTSKPDGRTLAYFGPLRLAEQKLLDACRNGDFEQFLLQLPRPENPSLENIVRASFLRFLALGGDEHAPVHEKGVWLMGAWVDGELDLEGTILPKTLALVNCHFNVAPVLRDSVIHGFVSFQGCHVEGLAADRMVCSGSVFLKKGFIATGKVSLMGAQIGGDLECHDSKFDGKGGDALMCERTVIKGAVLLRDGFTAIGTVSLSDTNIDGSLECEDGKFEYKNGNALICERAVIKGNVLLRKGFTANGTVLLNGVKIDGNLECNGATLVGTNGKTLIAQNMTVAGIFFFRELVSVKGVVSLVAAKVGTLVDDVESWSAELELDGFVYDRLAGTAPKDAKSRLAWLNKQSDSHKGQVYNGKDFKPQPWRQLQKVLREMGHFEDARQVAIAFEDELRHANLIGQPPNSSCKSMAWLYRKISRSFHWMFGWLIGYGYSPLGLFFKMLVVWLVCGGFYWYVALNGVFAPSNPLVFQNSTYDVCKVDNENAKAELAKSACGFPSIQGAGNWYLCEKLREEYTGFSPLAYSLDLILPLVDLQQERDWAPMIPTPKNTWCGELFAHTLKHFTRLMVWFEILFGWVAS